jgi:threonyl-tRNA synthetase
MKSLKRHKISAFGMAAGGPSVPSSLLVWRAANGDACAHRVDAVQSMLPRSKEIPPLAGRLLAPPDKIEGERNLASAVWSLMRKQELVALNPAAEKGHTQYLPKGVVLLEALLHASEAACNRVPVAHWRVECPGIYAVDEGPVSEHVSQFSDRSYIWSQFGHRVALRSDPGIGVFPVLAGLRLSSRSLPLGVSERQVCYRAEPSGTLRRMARVRSFHLVAMHVLCEPGDVLEQFDQLVRSSLSGLSLIVPRDQLFVRLRASESFIEAYASQVIAMAAAWDVLAEIDINSPSTRHPFSASIGPLLEDGEFAELGNVQLDESSAGRYELNFVDHHGATQRPAILHFTPLGSLERAIYTLCKYQALVRRSGGRASYPLSLAPTQLRLIIVNDDVLPFGIDLLNRILMDVTLRIDIDDRQQTVGRKVHDAISEWVPFYAVIGPAEQAVGRFRVDSLSGEKLLIAGTFSEMVSRLGSQVETESAHISLPMPIRLSQRVTW